MPDFYARFLEQLRVRYPTAKEMERSSNLDLEAIKLAARERHERKKAKKRQRQKKVNSS